MTGTNNGQTAQAALYTWDLVPSGPLQPYAASSPWTVQPGRLLGGNGTINWYYNGVAQAPFSFCIQAYNPSYADFYSALGSGKYWFAPLVSNHETNGSQVCEPSRMQASWCGGGYWGQPVWGYPQGYGAMQIDPPQGKDSILLENSDAYEAIWNWRSNLAQWQRLVDVFKAGSPADPGFGLSTSGMAGYPFWNRQVRQWNDWNSQNPASIVGPVPDTMEAGCTFSFGSGGSSPSDVTPGAYWFGDAETMKQLGGALSNYLSILLNPSAPATTRWNFCRANGVNANIVYEFCTCQQAAGCQRQVAFPAAPLECKTQ